MDGYHILPWLKTSGQDDDKMIDVEPWELPDMPEVSVDAWRYHVGFAIDRGFIECWSPDPEDAVTVRRFSEVAQNQIARILNRARRPPAHDRTRTFRPNSDPPG